MKCLPANVRWRLDKITLAFRADGVSRAAQRRKKAASGADRLQNIQIGLTAKTINRAAIFAAGIETMTYSRPYHGEGFCLVHGREHMRYAIGHPIPWCQECEDERETARRGTPVSRPQRGDL